MDLSKNKIEFIKKYYLSYLVESKKLVLNQNQTSSIESDSFRGLYKLENLILSENCIFKIDSLLFHDLKNLQLLHLSYNSFHILKDDNFKYLHTQIPLKSFCWTIII